jgi:hypothetical protein
MSVSVCLCVCVSVCVNVKKIRKIPKKNNFTQKVNFFHVSVSAPATAPLPSIRNVVSFFHVSVSAPTGPLLSTVRV